MTRIIKYICIIALLGLSAGAALGTVSWMKTFNALYTPSSESGLKKAKCAICHTRSNGKGPLNAYGKALDGKTASPAALKSIESADSDKDGATNITEIKAGTLPADPKSKP